ncbi:MAG: IS200/IS605 family element transposase accessory protein TnpB [Okeania sp. SIO2G4]|uniref:RNA-guided endonuclease InsQ/TnpB family protein n=1 Tax=unclassified Okeania TaxID=2634635 RepID=UPI0013BC3758|nr:MULTISPECIES: RNA-guided endonuclease TnpB family protein [unclassified Okeania]NEP03618.1 IS200/IS605 family element transposase accessory protein TnpB [Okeania sp. SIO4D6]NEP39004.1 IS200/IS605 family element transposase accessory protein TnpB [Okeania sp. SIO2H7]NEP71870.1 IS200/IS605 family element transposase accessory protein TnpB [Okeania sp. SIO2G5]NEP92890.1 IS200/IS605 family element transposase accessory protein TnpB [Okeania sp. SIO2F5]NEQ90966.1 IS200/IS605 family element trans
MVEKAYKFRFYPTQSQENLLRRTLGCVRLIYNKALAARTQAWHESKERVGYKQTSAMLTNWKKQEDLDFLKEVSSVPLQQGLRHLQTAFTNFFSGCAKYPNFKKKRNGGSAEFTKSAFKWKDGQVYLAKFSEPLPIRWSRQLPQNCVPSTITVKLDPSGRWSVSLRVNDSRDLKLNPVTKQVGIDLGITSLVTTSDGETFVNPKNLSKLDKKLRLAQKSLSRKTKGSNNYQKARLKVARIHARIKDSRLDYTHKLTTQLIRENQTVVVEDLAVKNMVKNHKRARAISDANWGELVKQLEYKAEWYGRQLIKIDRYFPSSKRCSNCGHVVEKLPLNIREWDCPECAAHHDRDINASINILAAGLAVSVCGATVRPEGSKPRKAGAMKQKAPNSDVKESRAVS